MRLRTALVGLSASLVAAPAAAQFNNQWLTYSKDTNAMGSGFSSVSSSNTETDMDMADADQDGWVDVAVVRKQPFTSTGKRTNVFLHNVNGALTDTTAQHASNSDVGGDNGFSTQTNDRDVIFFDANGDGWLDMVTATTLSDGNPKHIGHPRVYINLGGGSWGGFQHQDARIPQLKHFGSGNNQNPRFCSVATGDVTGNGVPDLYFGDYDSSGAGGAQQGSNEDMNDRLLINDGNGFYTDESQARMTSDMLLSAFGMASEIHDMNLDGVMDVIKDTALNPPQDVRVIYNNPANEGVFQFQNKFHTGFAPYHIDVGDLNNDGRPDIGIADDASDRHRYNTGGTIQATWGPAKTFQFLSGGDDGFGSNTLIADLDLDGWNDMLIADVDVDISGYNRRLHIYHNPGGAIGQQITLMEERQQSGGNGWLGAVGLLDDDLEGTHDIAVADFDNDGDNDLIISRDHGTDFWRNGGGGPPPACGHDQYGTGLGGANVADLDSTDQPSLGSGVTYDLSGFSGAGVALLFFSNAEANFPAAGGFGLVDFGQIIQQVNVNLNASGVGSFGITVPNNPNLIGKQVFSQAGAATGAGGAIELTNGLETTVCSN